MEYNDCPLPIFPEIRTYCRGVASLLNTSLHGFFFFFKYEPFDYEFSNEHVLHTLRRRYESSSTHVRAKTYAVRGLFDPRETQPVADFYARTLQKRARGSAGGQVVDWAEETSERDPVAAGKSRTKRISESNELHDRSRTRGGIYVPGGIIGGTSLLS